MSRPRPVVLLLSLVLFLAVADRSRALAATVPTGFADQPAVTVGAGAALDRPASMAFLPDGRLLVVEQKSAKIRLFVNGALAATDPVVALPSVRTAGGEQGLLGIAVDPGWPGRPYLYVHCDDASGPWIRISRYTAAGDLAFTADGSLTVDAATRYDLLNRLPDNASNHNGGTVRFGLDPKTLPLLEPLAIEVRLDRLRAFGVEVDFAGVDMNMGHNRPSLRQEGEGRYVGTAVLPVCVRYRMDWEARVLVRTPDGLMAAPFRFSTFKQKSD